ncbi:MAG: DUF3226 domain-containing protein [Candidatus Acidiferrales bacterium]
MPLLPTPSPITEEFLVVGEGSGDASFIDYLCRTRNISGFQVEDARGESKFVNHIKGLRSRTGYQRLKAVLVVSDNDESPNASFNKIRNYLKDAKVPYPETELSVARRDGLAFVVMMLPHVDGNSVRGCLETLLLQCIEANQPALKTCVDEFQTCMAGARTKNQTDKLRLRCFVAAMYAEDPNLALSFVLSPSKGLVDLHHSCFNEIATFLTNFPVLCEPQRRR